LPWWQHDDGRYRGDPCLNDNLSSLEWERRRCPRDGRGDRLVPVPVAAPISAGHEKHKTCQLADSVGNAERWADRMVVNTRLSATVHIRVWYRTLTE